jgi:hypothetical protein
VNEGIAGDLIIVIWQPLNKGYPIGSQMRLWPTMLGTSLAPNALLGVQIRIPGSDRVHSAVHGGSAAILKVLRHLSLIVPPF